MYCWIGVTLEAPGLTSLGKRRGDTQATQPLVSRGCCPPRILRGVALATMAPGGRTRAGAPRQPVRVKGRDGKRKIWSLRGVCKKYQWGRVGCVWTQAHAWVLHLQSHVWQLPLTHKAQRMLSGLKYEPLFSRLLPHQCFIAFCFGLVFFFPLKLFFPH